MRLFGAAQLEGLLRASQFEHAARTRRGNGEEPRKLP